MLLFSGSLASGKSALSKVLIEEFLFSKISSGAYLNSLAQSLNLPVNRTTLQNLGDELDLNTDYSWVITDVVNPAVNNSPSTDLWLFDAVRKPRQIDHFKNLGFQVIHVHLSASEETLRERYVKRQLDNRDYSQTLPYDVAIDHENERISRNLSKIADYIIVTDNKNPLAIASEIITLINRGVCDEDNCIN